MKISKKFIKECYNDAIKLKQMFKITEEKEWNDIITALELGVQLGHIYNININSNILKEKRRKIDNIGDEISDVLLQILYLGYLEKVNFNKLNEKIEYSNMDGIIVLYGQLIEALMEKNLYRFKKERVGYKNREEFIKDRIVKIYLIIINYSEKLNVNIINEFKKMEKDAKGFLKKYEKNNCL